MTRCQSCVRHYTNCAIGQLHYNRGYNSNSSNNNNITTTTTTTTTTSNSTTRTTATITATAAAAANLPKAKDAAWLMRDIFSVLNVSVSRQSQDFLESLVLLLRVERLSFALGVCKNGVVLVSSRSLLELINENSFCLCA